MVLMNAKTIHELDGKLRKIDYIKLSRITWLIYITNSLDKFYFSSNVAILLIALFKSSSKLINFSFIL